MTEPLGSMRRFDGDVVLITGAASGIGAAAAARFAAEGARIALADVDGDRLASSTAELGLDDSHLLIRAVDVGDEDQLTAFVDDTAATFGALHVLVNNPASGASGTPTRSRSRSGGAR